MAKVVLTGEQIIEIKSKLENGHSIRSIAKEYSVSQGRIKRLSDKYDIKRPITNTEILRKKMDGYLDLEKIICDKYKSQLISCEELGNEYGLGTLCIIEILKRNGIERRDSSAYVSKYSVNETFFEIIDSKEKAYMLGFLYADGCISDTSQRKSYKVQISLQQDDKEILEKFKNLIEYTGELRKIEPPKKYPNRKIQYQLSIENKIFYTNLYNHGLVPRKSYCATFPYEIGNEFYKSFILGIYDGDGCLYHYNRNNQCNISFTGTSELINVIGDIIEKELGIKKQIHLAQNSRIEDKNTRVLGFGGNK